MMKIAVCDDDISESQYISSYISKYFETLDLPFKINNFTEGQDLIENINLNSASYDILFLDIYMKFSNGIKIAKEIRKFDEHCKIIFITSSKEHAIESYEVRALYYILKPIHEDKLRSSIELAIEELNNDTKHIIIKNKKGTYRIIHNDILYIESKARVINIHLKSGEILSFYSKLEEFFQSLKDERFLKCHKSFIVNMDYIFKAEKNYFYLVKNISIPISINNLTSLKEIYFNYLLKRI